MPSSRPSIGELRAVTQAGIVERRSAEHWAGRLYMRPLSPYVTRELIRTPVTPDQLTVAMIVVGVVASVVVAWPGLLTAVVAALLIQLYLLLDCVDGEVARWHRRTSAGGVYLDRLGHHVVEGAFVVGLGFRAGGGPGTAPELVVHPGCGGGAAGGARQARVGPGHRRPCRCGTAHRP